MPATKSCFVSIPFGTKVDASGRSIDFDAIYRQLIKPAIEAEGLTALRADELDPGVVFQRQILASILTAEVMVADITTANPNIMYELGVRHALRRNVTVLVMAKGSPIPSSISFTRALVYDPDGGTPSAAQEGAFRELLRRAIREALLRPTSDSPIFEFFPELTEHVPTALAGARARVRPSLPPRRGRRLGENVAPRTEDPSEALRHAEAELRSTPEADSFDYIALLRRYRDVSAWDELIRAADTLPAEVSRAPEVVQLLALALNRRQGPGDQERAIAIIRELIQETDGDGESYGILGRIFKDRYQECRRLGDEEGARANLDAAIDAYRHGFEREPTNYYPGVNVVTLLLQKGDASAQREMGDLLPRVREAVRAKMADGQECYWEVATALELAVISGEWDEVERLADKIPAQSPAPWMVESTTRQLQMLASTPGAIPERQRLDDVIARLESGTMAGSVGDVRP